MRLARGRAGAAILGFALMPAVLHAQTTAPARPSRVQIDNAAQVLRIIMTALQSSEVQQPVKNALFDCVYSNPIGMVSAETDKVVAANAGKVDRKDASQMLAVIAGVCGYRPAAPAAKPAPKK